VATRFEELKPDWLPLADILRTKYYSQVISIAEEIRAGQKVLGDSFTDYSTVVNLDAK
jgi:hypothetical protein